jgi:hypothetical protein
MISAQNKSALPRYSLERLRPIEAGLVILAFLSLSADEAKSRDVLEQALHPLASNMLIVDEALARLAAEKLVTVAKNGRCRVTPAGKAQAEDELGAPAARAGWGDVIARGLAPLALGLDPRDPPTRRYFARKENMDCAALACLYGLRTSSRLPPRSEVRFLFLRALLSARLPECEPAFTEMTMQNTLRDPVSRALMLGAAGLQRGTLRDAEGALLHKALDVRPDAPGGIAEALVRNAVGKSSARPMPRVQLPPLTLVQPKENGAENRSAGLADFAVTVRDLAKTLKTPFAGRVAIAQVYDAGVQRGLDFGTLDSFKQRIAESCRAGLLDLERYDIAGPMDAALRERSRTPFGRDVRHFIVNEWI